MQTLLLDVFHCDRQTDQILKLRMNFELRHLRYFVAVAEAENVSQASKRLHVSQPPLSRQIRDLEDAVGVSLFDRRSGRFELTIAGRTFLHESRLILEHVEDAAALAKQAAGRDRNRLRIGHSAAASVVALPNILRESQRLGCDARIELRTMTTLQMIQSLRRGELDLCLSVCGAFQDLKEFVVTPLDTYGLVAAVAKHHPFVDSSRVSMHDLVQQPIVSLSQTRHPWFNTYLRDVLSVHSSSYHVVEEHDSTEGVVAAVEAGRGVALLYDVMTHVVGRRLVL
jgi:DNA-binding transcriptional LysR family regulator